ncbi:MAG: riboflavin synthase [Actinomycetota bacterium]
MFTGIIEELGEVRSFEGDRLAIACTTVADDAEVGASIAVNGTCLTVVERGDGGLAFDVSAETQRRTSLRRLTGGDPVNLERPLTLATRIGGHLVQGHVDGVGEVLQVRRSSEGTGAEITFSVPSGLRRYVVEKGSITIDGVSLTVAALGPTSLTVALIPHTLAATTFGSAGPGTPVNVEVDVIAKYVARYVGVQQDDGDTDRTNAPVAAGSADGPHRTMEDTR